MGKVYILSDSSCIYKSGYKIASGSPIWTQLPEPVAGLHINNVMKIYPDNANIIYASTYQVIACSTDAGATFTKIDEGLEAVQIRGGIQDPSNSDVLLTVSKSGIARSDDGGNTWTFVEHGAPWKSMAVDSTGAYIYAGGNSSNIMYSTDAGVTWDPDLLPSGDDACCQNAVNSVLGTTTNVATHKTFVDPVNENIVYAAISKGDYSDGGIFKGTRTGSSWSLERMSSLGSLPALCVSGYASGCTSVLFVSYGDKDSNTVAGLKQSTDGGSTWSEVSALSGYVIQCMAVDPNDSSILYLGTGYSNTSVAQDSSGTIFNSSDGGATWTNVAPNDGNKGAFTSIAIDPSDSSKVYAACENIVYTSMDSGTLNSWYPYYIGEENESFDTLFMFNNIASAASLPSKQNGSGIMQQSAYNFAIGSQKGLYLWGTSKVWYFVEGCTRGFDTYLLMENPNSSFAQVTATYYKSDGTTVQENYSLDAASRRTVHINTISGLENTDLSIKLVSDKSIIAERAMYWNNITGGHDSIGVTAPFNIWYFAEGCITYDFQERLLLLNSNSTAAHIALTVYDSQGNTDSYTTTVNANSRKTIYVNNLNLPSIEDKYAIGIKVDADMPVVAERAMYRNNAGHCSSGTTVPSSEWYLAEGCTRGFDAWILILNPGSTDTTCTATFYTSEGSSPIEKQVSVPAHSRCTIHVNDIEGLSNTDFSTKIDANQQIVVERAMYWGENWQGGACSMGSKSLSPVWYLSEGSTNGFDIWLLIMNPANSAATVNVTYLKSGESSSVSETYNVPAHSRYNIKLNNVSGLKNTTAVSEYISSDMPIVVERAMYFHDGTGGHVSKDLRG